MTPKEYCQKTGMKSTEFIAKVREIAPKYHKSTNAMVNNPDGYGVALKPFVWRYVRGEQKARKLPRRAQFRCSDELLARLTWAKELLGYSTIQEILHFIVKRFLDELEKETAAPSGTGNDGKSKIAIDIKITREGPVVK